MRVRVIEPVFIHSSFYRPPDFHFLLALVCRFQEGIGATLDRAFLSNLDCFHPSDNGHQALAIGLWNSMLCVDGRDKKCGHSFQPHGMQAVCPTKDSVFYTGPDVVPAPGAL